MRRVVILLSVVVVAIVILLVVGATLLNVDKYRPRIQSELQQKLGRPVTLGHLHLRLFPFSIRIDNVSIGESPAFPSSHPFASAKEVYVSAGVLSLIRGQPQINDLTLDAPQIELIRNAAGTWNFSDLGKASTATATAPTSSTPTASTPTASTATASSDRGTEVTLNRLKVSDGQIAVTDQRTQAPQSVYNHIDLTLTGFAPGKPFEFDGAIHFPGAGKELLTLSGTAGPLASGNAESIPINGRISVQQVSLAGLNIIAGDQVKGSISADLTVTGTVNTPQVQGTLSADSIQAQGIVLNNVRANSKMNNGVVYLSPITAGVLGGQESGTVTLDTKPAHPLCAVKTHLSGVDANALLSAVSSAKDTLYGSLAADANLSFGVDASANLAQTLNGVLSFNVTNGQLKNVNILAELSRIGKFLNSAPAQRASGTTLQKFSGTLDIRNGLATTNNLIAVLPEGSLSANGSLSLVNEGINLHMNAVLANTTTATVGGTGVGGFLNTALANDKGELVLPVLVTGSMAHPTFTPDVQAIAKMKMSRLLPTTGNPSSLASGILGSVLGGTGQQSNQKNKQQPQNPLNSILKGIGKKR